MPSPFGSRRNAAEYYQYGGEPMHFSYDWRGMPMQSSLSPRSALSGYVEVSEGSDVLQELGHGLGEDFVDVAAVARFHKGLSDYPVSMSMESATRSVRHSGAEQTQIYDMKPALGLFESLSDNEQKALIMMLVGGAGLLLWKLRKKGRK